MAVGGLLLVSVVQQDALDPPTDWSEHQTQLHHLLLGVCDSKEHASFRAGWTHLERLKTEKKNKTKQKPESNEAL